MVALHALLLQFGCCELTMNFANSHGEVATKMKQH